LYLFENLEVIFGLHYLLGCHSTLGASAGDVVLVTLHGAGSLVVDVVRVTPRVVRRKNEGVCDIPNGVVDPLVVRKSAVASIVPNTEYSPTNKALEPPIRGPERPFESGSDVGVEACAVKRPNEGVNLLGGLERRQNFGDYIEDSIKVRYLVEGVAERCVAQSPIDTLQGIFLMQLLGNGIVNALKGYFRELVGLVQTSLVSVGTVWLRSYGQGSESHILGPVLEDAQHLRGFDRRK
jgi:hypothetical protein